MMDGKKTVSIMVPCYNEEENVVPISEAIVAQMEALPQYDYEILFIDNCSTDNTRPLLRQICAKNRKIKASWLSRRDSTFPVISSSRFMGREFG